jgi:hypothetical protein
MCAAAGEIQGQWQKEYGDFYATGQHQISCWLPKQDSQRDVRQGFDVCRQGDVIRLQKFTWLPKQSQLIELAQVPGRRYESITLDFFNWTKLPYDADSRLPGNVFHSLEQIWLAYVMQKKFVKRWDGSRWVPLWHSGRQDEVAQD